VASHLLASVPELREYLGGKNALCDALVELFAGYERNHFGWAKEIWDVSTIGYLINPDWVPSALEHSPLLTDDCHYARDARRHFIRVAYFAQRTPIFRDMYKKLAGA
ncbi:MAG: nucleoside hydrolase, partial [Clostridiales bacterium]|nr:nucleoside hydrolase [Clostridiales bacterium]